MEQLASQLTSSRVMSSEESRERFSADESTRVRAMPTAVVEAGDEADVQAIMRWASAGRFPVIPRGAGTGVTGGAVAVGGGVIVTLEKMGRILEIDRESLTVTCEPGVITADLQEEVERLGLFYPPDPASAENCSIGGNVVVGAGGARAVKYGTTRDFVLGMRVVLPDGEVLSLGGKNVKDATGYHLLELMMGSEGTLGVITEITLRLLPLPSQVVSLLIPFPDIGCAAKAVSETIRRRIVPAVAEFIDEVAIEAASKYLGRNLPCKQAAGAYVFINLDGESVDELEKQMEAAATIAMEAGALDVLAAQDRGQQARLWESRKVLGDAMKGLSPVIGKADVVVPRGEVARLVERVKATADRLGISIACFGHAGDGNVHVNILRRDLDEARWDELLETAMNEVLAAVRELGGRPSGEHGIGVLKRAEMEEFVGPRAVALMRSIKESFDPLGILNPGKVL